MGQAIAQDFLSTFESGAFCDLEFRVGPQASIVKAHKLVLRARSPVFISLLDERWDTGNGGVIKLPEYRLQPFKLFLRFLYCDKLEDEVENIEDLIELLNMGKMYLLDELVNQTSQRLRAKMQNELNSLLRIFDACLDLDADLAEESFNLIKRNAGNLLIQRGVANISYVALKTILEGEGMDVEEIKLFNVVYRWIGGDEVRKYEAKTGLIPLIRFPLMDMEDFEQVVIPSGLLSQKQINHLTNFFKNKRELFSLDELQFKFRSRSPKIAKDSKELKIFLEDALPGDVIQLVEGQMYRGTFHITKEKKFITIEGQSGNFLPLLFGGQSWALILDGSCCKISKMAISDNEMYQNSGIIVRGFGNALENLKVEIRKYGIYLDRAVKCKLSRISLEKTQNEHIGICFNCCKDIEVEHVQSLNGGANTIFAEIMSDCRNIRMNNCQSNSSLNIRGDNVKFVNVNVGGDVIVEGDGHKFLDSGAKQWTNVGKDFEFVNCFGNIVNV